MVFFLYSSEIMKLLIILTLQWKKKIAKPTLEKSLVITKDDVKEAEKMVKMASKDSKQIKQAMKKKDVKKGSKLCWKICGPCLKKNATDVANDAISDLRSEGWLKK